MPKFDQNCGSNSQNLFDDNCQFAGDSIHDREECDKRFQIIEKLGEGAYGYVFKAVDLVLN
jgi:serine/threonine protein kinase